MYVCKVLIAWLNYKQKLCHFLEKKKNSKKLKQNKATTMHSNSETTQSELWVYVHKK